MPEDDVGYFSLQDRRSIYDKNIEQLIEYIIYSEAEALYDSVKKLLEKFTIQKYNIVIDNLEIFDKKRKSIFIKLNISKLIVNETIDIPDIQVYFQYLISTHLINLIQDLKKQIDQKQSVDTSKWKPKKIDEHNKLIASLNKEYVNQLNKLKYAYIIYEIIIHNYNLYIQDEEDKHKSLLVTNFFLSEDDTEEPIANSNEMYPIIRDKKLQQIHTQLRKTISEFIKIALSQGKKLKIFKSVSMFEDKNITKLQSQLSLLKSEQLTDTDLGNIINEFKTLGKNITSNTDTKRFEYIFVDISKKIKKYQKCINIFRISSILSHLCVLQNFNPHFFMLYFFELSANGTRLYSVTEPVDFKFSDRKQITIRKTNQVTNDININLSFILATTLEEFQNLIDQAIIAIFSFHQYTGCSHNNTSRLSNFYAKRWRILNDQYEYIQYIYDDKPFYLTKSIYTVLLWGYHDAVKVSLFEHLKHDYTNFLKSIEILLSFNEDNDTNVYYQIIEGLKIQDDSVKQSVERKLNNKIGGARDDDDDYEDEDDDDDNSYEQFEQLRKKAMNLKKKRKKKLKQIPLKPKNINQKLWDVFIQIPGMKNKKNMISILKEINKNKDINLDTLNYSKLNSHIQRKLLEIETAKQRKNRPPKPKTKPKTDKPKDPPVILPTFPAKIDDSHLLDFKNSNKEIEKLGTEHFNHLITTIKDLYNKDGVQDRFKQLFIDKIQGQDKYTNIKKIFDLFKEHVKELDNIHGRKSTHFNKLANLNAAINPITYPNIKKKPEPVYEDEKPDGINVDQEADNLITKINAIKSILFIDSKLAYINELLKLFDSLSNEADILTHLKSLKTTIPDSAKVSNHERPFYLHKAEIQFSYYVVIALTPNIKKNDEIYNNDILYISKHRWYGKVIKHVNYVDIIMVTKKVVRYNKIYEDDYVKKYMINLLDKKAYVYLIKHKEKNEYACFLINTDISTQINTDITDSEIDEFYEGYIMGLYTTFLNILVDNQKEKIYQQRDKN